MLPKTARGRIVAVVGPTASGKTALALALGRQFGGEIVSADSRQIYRGMDIGTAKPTRDEMRAVPHHLIDIKDPNEDYTVAEYKKDAVAAINDILKRGGVPILVGGTGLYVKAVLENLDIPAVKADPALRAKIEKEVADEGLASVFKKLVALDPEAAYIVDPLNPRRVVRAMEVTLSTGIPFTAQRLKKEHLFTNLTLGIDVEPDTLRERIDRRVDEMMKMGLIHEVKELVAKYGAQVTAFDAIGYREVIDYLDGKCTLEQAVADIKINTWHYAKRQMTWFKKDLAVRWVRNENKAAAEAETFLKS